MSYLWTAIQLRVRACVYAHAAEAEASFQLSSEGIIDYKD